MVSDGSARDWRQSLSRMREIECEWLHPSVRIQLKHDSDLGRLGFFFLESLSLSRFLSGCYFVDFFHFSYSRLLVRLSPCSMSISFCQFLDIRLWFFIIIVIYLWCRFGTVEGGRLPRRLRRRRQASQRYVPFISISVSLHLWYFFSYPTLLHDHILFGFLHLPFFFGLQRSSISLCRSLFRRRRRRRRALLNILGHVDFSSLL